MELFCLHSPRPSAPLRFSSWKRSRTESPVFFSGGEALAEGCKMCPSYRLFCSPAFESRSPISGSYPAATRSNFKAPTATNQAGETVDKDTVFVAGSTGRVGSRTVRELLKLGFWVRAGVRSVQRAEELVQSVQKMKPDGKAGNPGIKPVENLQIVECDLEKQGTIIPAIGNASVIICCIGASEKEVFDVTGPCRIDYRAAKNLIEAATVAKVDHFVLVTSLGTSKIGFPASLLNLFWGVLIWKRKAEETLIASGIPYTIVRPGGMERPTDSFKETHNLVLANEDTYFGGLVSNLQVAELIAVMAKYRKLSYCKVVEVIAKTTAPLKPMEELLAQIPSQREIPDIFEVSSTPGVQSDFTSSAIESFSKKEVPKTRPLSPYAVYEDLKPPTTPTPTFTSTYKHPKDGTVNVSPQERSRINDKISGAVVGVDGLNFSEFQLQISGSGYEDLKPPTSPSPNSPSTSRSSLPSVAPNDSRDDQQKQTVHQNSKPLSPYTMYEDLKPPSSPSPSLTN